MILARKLRSAVRLYRSAGFATFVEFLWAQSFGYIEAAPVLPARDEQRAMLLSRIFNDRPDYPALRFEAGDMAGCGALLAPYLRRQFFDVVRLADLDALADGEVPLVADCLYRRWSFPVLHARLPGWRDRLRGTKAEPVLDMMARRVALRLGRFGDAGEGLPPSGGDLAACLLRAEVLDAQGRMAEATRAFEEALRKNAENALVRLPWAFHLLKVGRVWEGLANWGVADALMGTYPLRKRRRQWKGEDLRGLRLMVVFEHGLGDMIQMARFLHPLARAHPAARIVGRVPRPLAGLFERSFPFADFVAIEEADPDFDLYVASMQLPLVLDVPDLAPTTDYLRLDASGDAVQDRRRKRIGICWRGHPRQYEETRSIPLESFARLFERADVDFVVLLNAPTQPERAVLDRFTHVLRPPITDFVELGRWVASCDLIVSVDTAVAHVAAAAGRPTLLLSRPDACWRWGPSGSRSPWYESVEVLRHPGDMDWPRVLGQAARRIEDRLGAGALQAPGDGAP